MSVTERDVRNELKRVMHPAIDLSLLDLGIIQDVSVNENKIMLTMAFPFANIPIGDQLINSVKGSIKRFNMEVEVDVVVMSPNQLQTFLQLERQNWKG